MQNLTLTITQLNTYIKQIIDAEDLISNVSVYGELSNYKISNGNAYFDLKEDGSQISCIKFGESGATFKNGDRVLVTGKLNYHVKLGRLTFVANKVQAHGMGELYKKYLELKENLEKEGVFDERYKKPLPKFAKTIGIVTSETGAVIRDILHVRNKKNTHNKVYIFPSKVQGVGAENDIVRGIEFFSKDFPVDLIIVARGGGSFEDLAPFNTEVVARAAFNCVVPIISAVGHETDFSLLDFASDFRAPTPSIAGEVAFFDYKEQILKINSSIESIKYFIDKKLKNDKLNVLNYSNLINGNVENLSVKEISKVKLCIEGINHLIETKKTNIVNKLEKILTIIEENNPIRILKRGFVKVSKDKKIVSSVQSLTDGDIVDIDFYDGKIKAKVIKSEECV